MGMEVRAREEEDKARVGGAQRTGWLGMIRQARWLRKAANSGGRRRGTSSGYVE